jgi:divalent metal cation (Fe/Co/Zn/Cd) transporter
MVCYALLLSRQGRKSSLAACALALASLVSQFFIYMLYGFTSALLLSVSRVARDTASRFTFLTALSNKKGTVHTLLRSEYKY